MLGTPFEAKNLKRVVGALLLFGSLIIAAFLIFSLAKDLAIWGFGRQVSAVMVDRWTEETSEEGVREKTFQYFIKYQFETEDGRLVTRVTSVGAREWVGFGMPGESGIVYKEQEIVPADDMRNAQLGNTVDVIYFPLYPEHNRLNDMRYIPLYLCLYIPTLALSLIGIRIGWSLARVNE
jgi:hypothetical protein